MRRAGLVGLAVALVAVSAAAQDLPCDNVPNPPSNGKPGFQYDPRKCGFDVGDLVVQRAPTVLAFQARVSDAKLPTGNGRFANLVVQLLRSGQPVCSETFSGVEVKAYVLNLEIGRGMSCALDQVLAETTEPLAFQICLNGTTSCLPPVALTSAPYAVKANIAGRAEAARSANIAGVANYAHRLTADRDLFLRVGSSKLGAGYLDFASPLPDEIPPWLFPPSVAQPERGGWIRWVPMEHTVTAIPYAYGSVQIGATWGLAGERQPAGTAASLDEVRVVADRVSVLGMLSVTSRAVSIASGGMEVGLFMAVNAGAFDATRLVVAADLQVTQRLTVAGDLSTYGGGRVGTNLTVDGHLAVGAGDTNILGAATFGGGVTASSLAAQHVLALGAPLRIQGALHFGPATPTGAGLRVQTSAVGGSELAIGTSGQTSGIRFRSRVIVEGIARFDSATFLGSTTANAGCGLGRAKRHDGLCVEVDECLEGTHTCGSRADSRCIDRRSTDTPPYFQCVCPVGTFSTTTRCYPRKTHRRIFATVPYPASALNSIAVANDLCQGAANVAPGAGLNADSRTRYEALLGLPTVHPASLITDGVRFVTLDGREVATNRADLLDGTLLSPVGVSAQGTPIAAMPWTGITNTGGPHPATCVGNPGGQMAVASPTQTTQWLEKAVAPCTESHPLLCVER